MPVHTVNLLEEVMIHSVSKCYLATELFLQVAFEDNNFYNIVIIMVINQCY